MDILQRIVSTLFTLLVCIGPFVLLVALGGLAAFLIYRSKKRKSEKLQTTLNSISGITLSGVTEVMRLGVDAEAPLTETLVDIAQKIERLTEADASPLKDRSLVKSVKTLYDYEQRASFGELPGEEWEKSRQSEIERVRGLARSLESLGSAAENGDVESLRSRMLDVASTLREAYHGHVAFYRHIAESEIRFPVPQPVQNLSLSAEHAAKYSLFSTAMQLVRTGHSLSVSQAITQLSEWMLPEWRIDLVDRQTGTPQVELYASIGNDYVLAHRGSIVDFDSHYPVSTLFDHLSPSERSRAEASIEQVVDIVAEPIFHDRLDPTLVRSQSERSSDVELAAQLSNISDDLKVMEQDAKRFVEGSGHEFLWQTGQLPAGDYIGTQVDEKWVRAQTGQVDSLLDEDEGTVDNGQMLFLAKYVLYTRAVQLIRSGQVNVGYYHFDLWARCWMWPEYDVYPARCRPDPGAVSVYERTSEGELKYRPLFRAYVPSFELNVPMAMRMADLSDRGVSRVLDLALATAKSLDPYSNELLEDDPRESLSQVVSRQGLTLALPPSDVRARGISMVDMCLATNWQTLQFLKILLCIPLSIKFTGNALRSKSIPEDSILESCAHWNRQWLKPHWDLVVGNRIDGYQVPDVHVTLYPIGESDLEREGRYFTGKFADFISEDSVVFDDCDIVDPNRFLYQACGTAVDRYGKADSIIEDEGVNYSDLGLVSIGFRDENLEQKARFNDRVLSSLVRSVYGASRM
jgi:hypothetical protein